MHASATTIRADRFVCNLDCYGYFPRAKIFWMGCKETPNELIQLHRKLGTALENCAYRAEDRSFTPHLTLMRKCEQAELIQAEFSIKWPVDKFALLESHSGRHGVNYRLIETYPLDGGGER